MTTETASPERSTLGFAADKGKTPETAPVEEQHTAQDDSSSDEDMGDETVEHVEDEEPEDDDLAEIDTINILTSKTRGRKVDYTKEIEKESVNADEEEDDEEFVAKDDDDMKE
ncbi:hypothetical protein NEOLI_005314 [Neolecta irregularis DAH-3]|uniref:Histone chaperone domain-containing protein n=1 Tax=Neolecta irregularis (strain DAH-3) TaxID=1198029 RepID=A0A1U7LKZ7_NEOID|nr:hypothetical protein NEOLI_005314 [Neolecta irregularis DAH-3]|eukprot:OLL23336.1 hypothetical protein NEOLI_005314 [Neolecta irregularis DAH-3]